MIAVVQRVKNASVSVKNTIRGKISGGLLVYLGVSVDDSTSDADWMSEKISNLRIFDDNDGKMNLSLNDLKSQSSDNGILVISQFTLLGDVQKGRRPSNAKAANPEKAKQLYEYFIRNINNKGLLCESGEFQKFMLVNYTNAGPVTIILDSKKNSEK